MNTPIPLHSSNRPRQAILFFLLLMLSNLTAQAQNNWTGNANNRDWNTAGNWSAGIPTGTSDVVIPSAPANQPVLSTMAKARSVEVQPGASLSISSAGSLIINGDKNVNGNGTAFYNGGTVVNSGQLVIDITATIGGFGLFNVATFNNNAGGTISIDRSHAAGLYNIAGSFTNSGTITIGAVAAVGDIGLYNAATFSNNAGGTISIDRTLNIGLGNDGSFTNSATITIGAVATVGSYGITNAGIFNNTGCGGRIRIVSNSIINSGSPGIFNNTGTIIENASGSSRINSNDGLVQNLNGGTFTITGTNTGVLTTTPGPLPTITATPSLTVTQGQSATLTASDAVSYSWSTGETTPAISVSVAGPYSVTGTTGGCSSTATVSITVKIVPTFTVSNPAICPGQYVNLGNYVSNKSPITGDLTYYTSLTNAQAATNALISGLVGPVNAPITYYVRYDAEGSFSIQPIMVTFKPASPAPPVLTQSGHAYTGGVASVTVAQNSESVSLAVPGCDGTVSWSGPNNFISFASTISVPTSTTGSFTYSASCSSQTACFSGLSQATVTVLTVIPAPMITLGTPGALCSDAVTVLIPYTATTGNPTAYTVSGTGISGSGSLSGSSGNLTASLTNGFTGSFSVVVQTSQGQSSSVVSGSVTVNAAPTASILGSPSLSVCQGASVTLTASGGDPGASYLWNNGRTTAINIINTNDPSGNPGPGGGYSGPQGPQSVTITNAAGCSASATITLTINPIPVASITPSSLTVCAGTPVSLTASGGSVYQWSSGQTTAVISVTATGTYSVTVSGTTGPVGETGVTGGRLAAVVGCYATASVTVNINPAPTVSINPSSTTLTNASPTVSLTAVGAGTYLWSTGATTPVISVTTSGTYSVTLTSPSGCTASASVPVVGSDLTVTLDFPQANFAASGSQVNFVVNVFEVAGLPTSSGKVTITVTAPIGYTLSFPAGLSSINVTDGPDNPVAVSNSQWTVVHTLDSRQLTLTMASGAFISGGGESSLGFIITRTNANSGSVSSISVNVADDLSKGYDGNLSNNVYARSISGL